MLLQKIRNSNLFELSKYQWKPVPRYEVSNSKHLATLNLGIKRFAKLNLKQAKRCRKNTENKMKRLYVSFRTFVSLSDRKCHNYSVCANKFRGRLIWLRYCAQLLLTLPQTGIVQTLALSLTERPNSSQLWSRNIALWSKRHAVVKKSITYRSLLTCTLGLTPRFGV